jgi:hypothetical protein
MEFQLVLGEISNSSSCKPQLARELDLLVSHKAVKILRYKDYRPIIKATGFIVDEP